MARPAPLAAEPALLGRRDDGLPGVDWLPWEAWLEREGGVRREGGGGVEAWLAREGGVRREGGGGVEAWEEERRMRMYSRTSSTDWAVSTRGIEGVM